MIKFRDPELQKVAGDLTKFHPAVVKEINAVIDRNGRKFMKIARTLAPVEDGKLKAQIKAELNKSKTYTRFYAYVDSEDLQDAIRSRVVEFGLRANRSVAQPFFVPAALIVGKSIKRGFKRGFRRAAERVLKDRKARGGG